MKASIVYLLTLIGVGAGIALSGLTGGLVGGVLFYLLHRVYTLAQRLSAIDKQLLSLDDVLPPVEEKPSLSSEASTSLGMPAASAAAPDAQVTEPSKSSIVSTEVDAIAALNTTLQALLPVLSAMQAAPPHEEKPKPLSEITPHQNVQESHAHDIPSQSLKDMDQSEAAELASIATAIEVALLDALQRPTVSLLPQNAQQQASIPATQRVTPDSVLPITGDDKLNNSNEPASPQHEAIDLARLKEELGALMNDITTEHARQSQIHSTPHTEVTSVDAQSIQDMLIELRKLTAKLPPSKN